MLASPRLDADPPGPPSALSCRVSVGYSPAVAGAGLLERPGGGSDSASLPVLSGDCGGPSSLRRAVEGWVPLRGMVAEAG